MTLNPRAALDVCIVDDDEAVGDSLCALLAAAGMSARAHTSPLAALACDRLHRFDCFLVDVHMAEMTGFAFFERLRGLGVTAPVVLTSGRDRPGLAEAARSAGAAGFLEKPFQATELLATLRRATGASG